LQKDERKKQNSDAMLNSEIRSLKSSNEILQVMFWMTGEGLGDVFDFRSTEISSK